MLVAKLPDKLPLAKKKAPKKTKTPQKKKKKKRKLGGGGENEDEDEEAEQAEQEQEQQEEGEASPLTADEHRLIKLKQETTDLAGALEDYARAALDFGVLREYAGIGPAHRT